VVSIPQGDSEVEDWVVVYDYPKHTEIEAGLQEHAAAEQVCSRKNGGRNALNWVDVLRISRLFLSHLRYSFYI
jgi:hypothetical protein